MHANAFWNDTTPSSDSVNETIDIAAMLFGLLLYRLTGYFSGSKDVYIQGECLDVERV